jgi:REP element-mobilizing transposase RayT
MTVRFQQPHNEGVYFITFTCHQWLPLIQNTDSYHLVYKWFDYLKEAGNYIVGYTIMPNHLHAIIAFVDNGQSINTRVGNGKRFLAYGIVDRLKEKEDEKTLTILQQGVNITDKKRGKLHQVFEPSFDCKECVTDKMLEAKLEYMHNNPCRGKWNLAKNPIEYRHSSARFYVTGEQGFYPVIHHLELNDVSLTISKSERNA